MIAGSNTKEQIIDLAEHFIMSRGYNGFSYKDISSKLNIKNAAIHYHFPAKKDLGVAVIERAHSRFIEWGKMIASEEMPHEEMLNTALDHYLDFSKSEKYICLGGSLETDFNTLPKEMQNEIKVFTSATLRWMGSVLSSGREKGAFTFSGSSEDKAFLVLSSIQGAIQIARVTDKAMFVRLLDNVKADLGI